MVLETNNSSLILQVQFQGLLHLILVCQYIMGSSLSPVAREQKTPAATLVRAAAEVM